MNREQPTIPRKKFIVRDVFSKLRNVKQAIYPIGVYFNYQLLLAIRIIDEPLPRAELKIKCNNLNEETTQFSFVTKITISTGYRSMWTEKCFNEKSNEIVIDWENVLIYRNLDDFCADLEVSFCDKRIDFENIWVSNVIIKVGNFNFNLIKDYLVMNCEYFQGMFSGFFKEADQKVVEIQGIDPYEFQNFLDILHDKDVPILESQVAGVLKLATFFGAAKVIRECEDFLLADGWKHLKLAFQLSYQYNIEKLKKKCLNFVCCYEQFKIVRPENLDSLTKDDINQLFETSLQLRTQCSSPFVHTPCRELSLISSDFLPYRRPDSAAGFESLREQRLRIFASLVREEGYQGSARNEPPRRNRMGQNRNPPRGIPDRDQLRRAGPDGRGRGNPNYVPFNHHPHAPPRNQPNPNHGNGPNQLNEPNPEPLPDNRNNDNGELNVPVPAPHPLAIVELPRGVPNRDQLRRAGPDGRGRGNLNYVPFNHYPHAPPRNQPIQNHRHANEVVLQPLHVNRNQNIQDGRIHENVPNQVDDVNGAPNVAVLAAHPPAIVEGNNQNNQPPIIMIGPFDCNQFAVLFFTFTTLFSYYLNTVAYPFREPLYASIICLFVNLLFRLFCMK